MSTQIQEYSKTDAALADLQTRYTGATYAVTTPDGMRQAIEARSELRTLRVDLEKKRVEIKSPALERCRLIDAEAKRITAALADLEDPIDAQIKTEERRKESERAAKAEAERQRVTEIQRMVADIRANVTPLAGKSSAAIAEAAADLQALAPNPELFAEFHGAALAAKAETLEAIGAMYAAALSRESEEARIAEERAELARLRAAEEQRQADARAAERAQAAVDAREAAERAERQAKEDAERAQAAEQLRKDQQAAAVERARLEAEALDQVTLVDAAQTALTYLIQIGHGSSQPARMLDAALEREFKEAA